MTLKEALLKALTTETIWHRRVILTELFHVRQVMTHSRKWTIKHTAKSLNKSAGFICESLELARLINTCPEIKQITSRNKALEFMRNKKRNAI